MKIINVIRNLVIAVFILTATIANSQTYHEECKEDLRAFMRQGTNWEKLGLEVSDTLAWYENENWVEKVKGVFWIETEDPILRVSRVHWYNSKLEGELKLNSPIITILICESNNLTELDVSNNIELEHLNCILNNLSELDVSNNIYLENFFCAGNNLIELNISNNTYLKYLLCHMNNLTKLDVTKNIELEILNCAFNSLEELDVSNNIKLVELICSRNYLTELDVSNNTELYFFACAWNLLKFSTLPIINIGIYGYYSQDTIYGGVKSYMDTADLSSEYNINGNITTYEWFDITDGTDKEIEQPTNINGVFSFTEEHIDKRLRCKMKNAQFPLLTLVYETDIVNNIKETIISSSVAPNITSNIATLALDLENAGNLTITLTDLLGQELFELHNTFEYAGTFTKEFSIEPLPRNMYYLKIIYNENVKVEKIIRN